MKLNLAEWARDQLGQLDKYNLPLGEADPIEVFDDVVWAHADAGIDTIELPTDLLLEISKSINPRRAGRPSKSWLLKRAEFFEIMGARQRIKKLKPEESSPGQALERVARELQRRPLFEKLALKTIKRRLQRRHSYFPLSGTYRR
jgi:hypothetical protein